LGGDVGKVITGKTACKDCKYWGNPYEHETYRIIGNEDIIYCSLMMKTFHPIAGVKKELVLCSERNKDGYCPEFTEKPPGQPIEIEREIWPELFPGLITLKPNERIEYLNGEMVIVYQPIPRPWWKFWG
jgi:hypothetical protein